MLSVLYQYENLTEDLEEDVKTGEKKRRPGGENKVGSIIQKTETFWNWHQQLFQLKSSNGNTYVELKCSDVEEDEEEEGVEFLNNNKWENYYCMGSFAVCAKRSSIEDLTAEMVLI